MNASRVVVSDFFCVFLLRRLSGLFSSLPSPLWRIIHNLDRKRDRAGWGRSLSIFPFISMDAKSSGAAVRLFSLLPPQYRACPRVEIWVSRLERYLILTAFFLTNVLNHSWPIWTISRTVRRVFPVPYLLLRADIIQSKFNIRRVDGRKERTNSERWWGGLRERGQQKYSFSK